MTEYRWSVGLRHKVTREKLKAAKLRQKTPTAQGDSDREATETGNYISQPLDTEKEA